MAKRECKQKHASKEDETDAALLHTLGVLAARPNKEEVDPDTHFCMELASRLRRLPPRQNALAKIRLQQVFFDLEYPSAEYTPTPVSPTNTIDNSYYEY